MKRPVKIKWVDSCSPVEPGWISRDDAVTLTPSVIQSVGFVIRETKTAVTLSSNCSEDTGQVYGVVTIPIVAILSRKKL